METVTKRQIRAIPHWTATETWEIISKLLASEDTSSARAELTTKARTASALNPLSRRVKVRSRYSYAASKEAKLFRYFLPA